MVKHVTLVKPIDADGQPTTPASRCIRVLDLIDAELDRPFVQMSLPYCIVLCLVSALVWTWSIAWVPSLLHNVGAPVLRPPPELPSHTVVVDCGSGKVAVHRYSMAGEGTARRPREVSKDKAAIRLPELMAGSLAPLWDLIDPALDMTDVTASSGGDFAGDGASVEAASAGVVIFFGATGGVRAALEDGSLTLQDVAGLEAAVRARYQGRAAVHFEVLTGAREAELELKAARFAFSDATSVFGSSASPSGGAGSSVSVSALSCGGKTCQIGWGDSGPGSTGSTGGSSSDSGLLVLDADLFAAQRVAAAVGLPAALEWWEGRLRETVATALRRHKARGSSQSKAAAAQVQGQLNSPHARVPGPAVGLTMLASAAELAGLAGRVVSGTEVAAGCGALLSHASSGDGWWRAYFFDQDAQGGNPYDLDQQTFNLVTVLSVSRLRVVVEEAFSPAAELFFARSRELPQAAGGGAVDEDGGMDDPPVNIEWPLGALLAFPWD